MKRILLFTFLTLFMFLNLDAQRNCGSMEVLNNQLQQSPKLEEKMENIEKATRSFLQKDFNSRVNGTITIPVVVHVVYNNSTENISDAQIQSQITILNEDFRRLNSDASNTPLDFTGVAADAEIEFCLATVDPNGNSTNGITRTSTSVTSFGTNDQVKFASSGGKDAWPASDYLNVWVCDISGGILGYAQFPGGSPSTDGVVNDYAYFGNIGTATAPFNLGRTMTHEVGHWLNLRHIWGDGNCNADDFVTDTPTAGGPNYTGSPCTYPGPNSCNDGGGDLPDMFQNYMDYSDDGCMNLFTSGQKARMRALFDTGGFRASLLTSSACGTPPTPTCSDGIQNGQETGVDCGGPDCAPCQSGCQETEVVVTINLDNYPEETSWVIRNASNAVVASGGTYGSQPDGSTVQITECLPGGCYDFIISDSYGDGICCGYGNGSYNVTAGGSVVASGGSFGSSETTNFCIGGTAPTCTDGIQNGQETGVDCGGPDCPACPPDPTCNDGLQNGQETGVDCGGPDCPACPTCSDGIQNGQETGVDCGGPDCPTCPPNPTCNDGVQNGNETGIDCGGPDCSPCDPGSCTYVQIDFEDFESGWGIWNDGGSDCVRSTASTYANSGIRTARLRDNTNSSVTTTDNLNLAGFEEVTIDFTYVGRSMENGEDFWLQASTNGGSSYQTLVTWARGSDFSNELREFESIIITGTFTSNTRFRFRCDASSNSDYVYIDDVNISGCTGGSKEGAKEPGITESNLNVDIINEIKLFPNPANEILNIDYSMEKGGKVRINVLDISGRVVQTISRDAVKGYNRTNIQVNDLNAGIYYIQLGSGEIQLIEKFVVID